MIPSRRGEAGETFVELLITVVILGIAVAAILGGMSTSVIGSDIHRKQSVATPIVIAAAEAVKDVTLAYKNCATATEASYVNAVAGQIPPGWPAAELAIRYWTGSGFDADVTLCVDASLPAGRAQEITIKVRTPDDRATETIAVVKRGN